MKARDHFRAPAKLKLRDKDADRAPLEPGKDEEKARMEALSERIATLQTMLLAERKRKVLVVLQGIDTAGKDGAMRALFKGINPIGLRPVAFKAPTEAELERDYLWRVHREVPKAGEIAIFNRSHYEEVLVPLVHGTIKTAECKRRYAQIRDFERLLAETGTVIVKIFLHISRDEQRERLQARLDEPEKRWKFDPQDLKERELWNQYQKAYEDAIAATDADHAPWYVVPANSKPHRNVAVASLLLETLENMKLKWPEPAPELLKLQVR
ncbi:PPK2 family polyphosphate kinase [Massilia sp. YIM B04103]|uniref:PPK2 family polyphosphate kinase n=1 Tax=Massilia sp. YIM B04103 TaxID=2963106 RepID=UPI00210EA6DE|nr:PPK2 family polyphosphate kinase [Massilia sp. YIM B04103]